MAKQLSELDLSELTRDLHDELVKGYNALEEFRAKVATEIKLVAPGPLKKPLEDIDQIVLSAQGTVTQAFREIRKMAPKVTRVRRDFTSRSR